MRRKALGAIFFIYTIIYMLYKHYSVNTELDRFAIFGLVINIVDQPIIHYMFYLYIYILGIYTN